MSEGQGPKALYQLRKEHCALPGRMR
jgi:hypothetical protein